MRTFVVIALVILIFLLLVALRFLFRLDRRLRMLRDAVPAFDSSALMSQLRKMATASQAGRTQADFASELDAQDRLQMARLLAVIRIMDSKVDLAAEHSIDIADDLAATHARANESDADDPGAAADAAMRLPVK